MSKMLSETNHKKLKDLIFLHLDIDSSTAEEDVTQERVANWTSAKHLSLIMEIEALFGINLKINEVVKMNTFNNIAEYLTGKGF